MNVDYLLLTYFCLCPRLFVILFHNSFCSGENYKVTIIITIKLQLKWRFGLAGNVVGRINEVNQRRARLVVGWVTVGRRVNHLGS